MIKKIARHSDLMNEMAARAGIDLGHAVAEGALSPSRLRNAVLVCARCENVAECERFLAGEGVNPGVVPDYCLSNDMFARLKAGAQ